MRSTCLWRLFWITPFGSCVLSMKPTARSRKPGIILPRPSLNQRLKERAKNKSIPPIPTWRRERIPRNLLDHGGTWVPIGQDGRKLQNLRIIGLKHFIEYWFENFTPIQARPTNVLRNSGTRSRRHTSV